MNLPRLFVCVYYLTSLLLIPLFFLALLRSARMTPAVMSAYFLARVPTKSSISVRVLGRSGNCGWKVFRNWATWVCRW